MGGGVEWEGEMAVMWLPFRCRLRREVKDVRGAREEREGSSLYSRLRETRFERRGEEDGMGERKGIWLVPTSRVVRLGKADATVTMSDQERRVSSRASSLMPARDLEAEKRSSEVMLLKRLPLLWSACGNVLRDVRRTLASRSSGYPAHRKS